MILLPMCHYRTSKFVKLTHRGSFPNAVELFKISHSIKGNDLRKNIISNVVLNL